MPVKWAAPPTNRQREPHTLQVGVWPCRARCVRGGAETEPALSELAERVVTAASCQRHNGDGQNDGKVAT